MLAGDNMRPEPLQRRRGRIAVGHVDQPHRTLLGARRPQESGRRRRIPSGNLQHAGDLSLVAQHGGRRDRPAALHGDAPQLRAPFAQPLEHRA